MKNESITEETVPVVSLKNAGIRSAGQTLFPDISFEVRRGEHWAFTGPHEALKTAVLEALAGKSGIVKGSLHYPFIEQQLRTNNSDALVSPRTFVQLVSFRHPFRNLSNTTEFYYQQRFNSSDSENALTVAQYLEALQPDAGAVWTFEKVVDDLKLQALLDETVIKLSNGETKRVLLAAVLLRNPVLLLLHNPLAGLDVASRHEISALINTIAHSGTTIITTAAPAEIPEAVTHVAVFNADATIATLLKKDFNPITITTAPVAPLDVAELKALLQLHATAPYNDIVRMQDVTIRYGDHLVLDRINWTVKQGERWALTGPNGSGKSTLLSLINGDNPQAFANDIVLFDRRKGSGESIWDIKKKIGFFSPELYQYFPVETSCAQAVESGFWDTIGLFRPSNAHMAGIALRWMKLLHIEPLAAKLLRQASPVQQRLCLLARALVKSPVLLLLDEPCQGFDAAEAAYFKQLIDAVCSYSDTTLIYVSHYAEELPDCITKHFTLQKGKQVPE